MIFKIYTGLKNNIVSFKIKYYYNKVFHLPLLACHPLILKVINILAWVSIISVEFFIYYYMGIKQHAVQFYV